MTDAFANQHTTGATAGGKASLKAFLFTTRASGSVPPSETDSDFFCWLNLNRNAMEGAYRPTKNDKA